MTPALNWERYEYICWQAREAVPPDVEERIQGPFLSAPESGSKSPKWLSSLLPTGRSRLIGWARSAGANGWRRAGDDAEARP